MQPFLQAALIELVTGQVIASGTSGDKAKESARATEIVSIVNALKAIESGNSVSGLALLQSSLQTTALTPAEAMAFNNFTSWLSTQVTLLSQVPGTAILGEVQAAILNTIGDQIIATCQKYITAPVAPAA